jgi:hypothetical protein
LELVSNALNAQRKWISLNHVMHFHTDIWSVVGGWNLISLPVLVGDPRVGAVFPNATSAAFALSPQSGYVRSDSLRFGRGYWLKFPSPSGILIDGIFIGSDTVAVVPGWEMVGSPSYPVSVSDIKTIPDSITTGSYLEYDGGYVAVDTLRPAHGYWVRVSAPGQIILNSGKK